MARYHPASIVLHWLMFVLVALAYAFVELRELFPRGTPERSFMRQAHFSFGLSVLGLVGLRLWMRLRQPAPPIHPPLPGWQSLASRLFHAALYVFMIGMPLAGWFILSLRGDPVPFFGLTLPPLAGENEDLGQLVRDWHGDIGRAFYAVVGVHALAAIYHHTKRRDDTLLRMLPSRRA